MVQSIEGWWADSDLGEEIYMDQPEDTLFLTDLKTQTSLFERSMIVHVCARFEVPEFSAKCLASGPLNSLCFGSVCGPSLVDLPLREREPSTACLVSGSLNVLLLAWFSDHALLPCSRGTQRSCRPLFFSRLPAACLDPQTLVLHPFWFVFGTNLVFLAWRME
ncbi:hypothetical protein CsSME_00042808 [Camellia sinensis var. sinensis]